MLTILACLLLIIQQPILAADDEPPTQTTTPRTTTSLTTADDNIVRLTLARQTTPTEAVANTLTSSSTTRVPTSQTAENSDDEDVFKILLTMPTDDNYYNGRFAFGGNGRNNESQHIELRLDLIQPDVWVMNNDSFLDCSYLSAWWSSEEAQHQTNFFDESASHSLPESLTTRSEFTASNCARNGRYAPTVAPKDQPEPTAGDFNNGEHSVIPYMNLINAQGTVNTNNVSFNITNGQLVELEKFSFIDVNQTNMNVGGLGLAGTPSNNGFLYSLVNNGIIRSPGYSLWFNNALDWENAVGQLIPGIVNKKYYNGDLVAFKMIPQTGTRFPPELDSVNLELNLLNLPIVLIDDLVVENLNTGQTLSIKSSGKDAPLPVLLDSRSFYTYLPLDIIINLAIQTNAYYSSEAQRWLVECNVILRSNAALSFVFGKLNVRIPLTEFITAAIYEGKTLTFEDGQAACFLAMSPTSQTGYNSLGLPFLRRIYLVVDNEGQNIAMANSNNFLSVDKKELLEQESRVTLFNTTAALASMETRLQEQASASSANKTTSSNNSIAFIAFGQIPFATTESNQASDVVFLFTSIYASGDGSEDLDRIPARLSGAIIRSGSIYLTGVTELRVSTTSIPGRATAASLEAAETSSSAGVGGKLDGNRFTLDIELILGIIGGITIILIL